MHTPDPYLRGHGDTRYRVRHYDLSLQYKVSTNRLDEHARLEVEITQPTSRIALDLQGLQADRIHVDGKRARHRNTGRKVIVELGRREPGDRLEVSLRISGKPGPVPGVHGEAGWEELTDGAMVGSQPQGAPSWFPCNNDAADKATYRIAVTTLSDYAVIANGTLTSSGRAGNSTTWVYEMLHPMAPYLATVQIGSYAVDPRAASVPVEVVHPRGLEVGEGTAFERQAEMLDFFSELFGPYPFEQYRAVIVDDELEIPLEAQGMSTFGRNFVPPTWDNERLVAHELSHQWFGNALTASLLHDIWLHEGFACYAEWLWSEHRSRSGAGLTTQEQAKRHHAELPEQLEDCTLADPGMEAMFDDWVYKRGALTLHALRALAGDDDFFALLRSWVREHAGGVVDTATFIEHCCTSVPTRAQEIRQSLHTWLHTATLPPLPVID